MRAMFSDCTTAEVFTLVNPEEHTILEWARLIIELCGATSPLAFEEKRQDDPERRRPDITRARSMLGWEPTTDPKTGLTRTIAWFRRERERAGESLSINS